VERDEDNVRLGPGPKLYDNEVEVPVDLEYCDSEGLQSCKHTFSEGVNAPFVVHPEFTCRFAFASDYALENQRVRGDILSRNGPKA
jgi:hypothetical protein